MNRIFKYLSLSAIALMALSGCTDELYLSSDSVKNGDSHVPFGTITFRTAGESRATVLDSKNLSAVEATSYTDIENNVFKFEKYRFDVRKGERDLLCKKNPQWPGIHRYRKPNENGEYSDDVPESDRIPSKYSDWKNNSFVSEDDTNYADFHEPKPGKVVKEEDVPKGYVYLVDYEEPDWIYIVDYDEPSTLNLFVYSPPLEQLRESFNSGTPGKQGSEGILHKAPNEVYDFFNTYVKGVGLTPPCNYNERTELKIYYEDGVAKPGYKLGMFHVAQDISRQVDFVTAHVDPKARKINVEPKTVDGVEEDVYTLETVPLKFEHQLCNIEIHAKNGNPNYDVDVAGVMIGRAMVYGPMFNFTTNAWEYPPLTRQDLYDIVSYAYFPGGDSIRRLGPNAVSIMGKGGNAMVLPVKLDAWDYKRPDNEDAYNFNSGDKPIMFFAALVRVSPKRDGNLPETLSITNMMYPFGYPGEGDWIYDPKIGEGGAWYYDGYDWGYMGGGEWYNYEFDPEDEETEFPGWEYDPETGYWTYIDKDGDWEMFTDEDDNVYWKYKGEYIYDNETRMWKLPIIFPTDYVCEKSNFAYQEFCVDEEGKVLETRYNDRDKCEFTSDEKKEYRTKYKGEKISFNKFAWVGFPVSVDWQKGNKYVYTLDFTPGLGVELPNGIYGGRLISDIVKLFADQEANEKTGNKSSKKSKTTRKKKSVKLPNGTGSVKLESSGKWTGPMIVK